MTHQERGIAQEELEAVAGIVNVVYSIDRGEKLPPPFLPLSEVQGIEEKKRAAFIRFAIPIINILTDPWMSDVMQHDAVIHFEIESNRTNYEERLLRIMLTEEDGQPHILLINYEDHDPMSRGCDDSIKRQSINFQERVRGQYPNKNDLNPWKFENVKRAHETQYGFKAVRELELEDLAKEPLFAGFVRGSKRILERLLEQIKSLSMSQDEADRIKSLTAVCITACEMMEQAQTSITPQPKQ